jgi:hypothetical protein
MKALCLLLFVFLQTNLFAQDLVIKNLQEFKNVEEFKSYLYDILKKGKLKKSDLQKVKDELAEAQAKETEESSKLSTAIKLSDKKVSQKSGNNISVFKTDSYRFELKYTSLSKKNGYSLMLGYKQDEAEILGANQKTAFSKLDMKKFNSPYFQITYIYKLPLKFESSFGLALEKETVSSKALESEQILKGQIKLNLKREFISSKKSSLYLQGGVGLSKFNSPYSLRGGTSSLEGGIRVKVLGESILRFFGHIEAESLKKGNDQYNSREFSLGLSLDF